MWRMSALQKVTLGSCVLLCAALLLPKILLSANKREAREAAGRAPPMLQRSPAPPRGAGGNRPQNPEANGRARGSTGAGGKSSLAGQIIPVYGFGILLYITYIIYKITSGSSSPRESRSTVPSQSTKRKITDFELTQLQERLMETEEVMETIVSRARAQNSDCLHSVGGVEEDQEEKLLLRLREITRVMQEGRLVEESHHHTFTDDPEESLRSCAHHCCTHHHHGEDMWNHEEPDLDQNHPADGTIHEHLSTEEPAEEPAEMMAGFWCNQTSGAVDGSAWWSGIRRRREPTRTSD